MAESLLAEGVEREKAGGASPHVRQRKEVKERALTGVQNSVLNQVAIDLR